MGESFEPISSGGVRGFLHYPSAAAPHSIVLTHGAGSNANAPLLIAVAAAFADLGLTVLRIDLPFRQLRPNGPPSPAMATRDRAGLAEAAALMRTMVSGAVFVGGHSYGGRQATIAAAEEPGIAAALLLLSYPLHPPRKPQDLRTAHFPELRVPAFFAHGTRDPFGSAEELREALNLIPARTNLLEIEGGSHDLARGRGHQPDAISRLVVREFLSFMAELT